jgi:hypothetical protein
MPTPAPSQKMQCRYLKPDGVRCIKPALNNEFYCFHHGRDRRHTRNTRFSPAIIQIPLLDNRAAIQVVLTDIARGLAAGTLDLRTAHAMTHVLRLASLQLPRPRPESALGAAAPAPAQLLPEPVDEITLTPEGDELGPELPYHGPNGKPSREWSFSEFLYRSVFPKEASDPLPEEGYIDPAQGPTLPPPTVAPGEPNDGTVPASADAPIDIIGLYEPAQDFAGISSPATCDPTGPVSNDSPNCDRNSIPDMFANEAISPAQPPFRSRTCPVQGHLSHRIQPSAVTERKHRRPTRNSTVPGIRDALRPVSVDFLRPGI